MKLNRVISLQNDKKMNRTLLSNNNNNNNNEIIVLFVGVILFSFLMRISERRAL
jgi:hypothetical protein